MDFMWMNVELFIIVIIIGMAGCIATLFHDGVMTPADGMKIKINK